MDIVETASAGALGELHLARLRGGPGRLVEFVDTVEPGVPKARKWVLMISTQEGCPVGCTLCDAGSLGRWANLTAEQMLLQVRHVLSRNPGLDPASHPKLKVHFARMGEPALNPAVLEALRGLRGLVPGPGLLPSLSTVAPATPAAERFLEGLKALKDELYAGGAFQMQFSLHSTDEEARRRIVPIRTWELERVARWGRAWRRTGDRKVTLNFAAPPGAPLDAAAVAGRFDPEHFLVKVTPVNPTATALANGDANLWHEAPAPVGAFADELRGRGFEVLLSPSAPEEIEAATSCGQLWSEALKGQARARRPGPSRAYVTAAELPAKAREWAAAAAPFARGPAGPLDDAALLVVDMQEFFLSPESPAHLPASRAILGNVARLVGGFRAAGRPVAFTVHAYADFALEAGPMARWWRRACLAGTPGARVGGGLAPLAGEPVLRKTRYSAFSNLELRPWLSGRGARGVVVCGVMTNLCVESTAREAFSLGLDVRIPLDACAASAEELHVATLKNAAYGFAGVAPTEDLLTALCPKSC